MDDMPHGHDDYLWDPRAAPDPSVAELERALGAVRHVPRELQYDIAPRYDLTPPVRTRWMGWPLAAAAAALLLIATLQVSQRFMRPWAVVLLPQDGSLATQVDVRAPLEAGQWLITDSQSRARLNVGSIGRAEIGPRSRIRLVRSGVSEHRLSMSEGTLHARIWAPPRFFLVETPRALAIDLGCVYTMHVTASGEGWLRVESGEVELADARGRVRVPAGNSASLTSTGGIGAPYPSSAPERFRVALAAYESAPNSSAALDAVLRDASSATTITLWHLLSKAPADQRDVVFARLAALAPPPATVTREGIERLDAAMLEAWRRSLQPAWSSEHVPAWKRWWRALWLSSTASPAPSSSAGYHPAAPAEDSAAP